MNPSSEPTRFNIGQAAEHSGATAKMIRHYESLGLLPAVARSSNGYRVYSEADINTLSFIRRARDLGFSMAEIGDLVKLWQNRRRTSAQVKRITQSHIADLDRRMQELAAMKRALEALARECHGDERSECPILDDLARPAAGAACPHHPEPAN